MKLFCEASWSSSMELFCEKFSLKIFNQKLFNQTDEGNSLAGALRNSAQLLFWVSRWNLADSKLKRFQSDSEAIKSKAW